jgi:hypothetical protein
VSYFFPLFPCAAGLLLIVDEIVDQEYFLKKSFEKVERALASFYAK